MTKNLSFKILWNSIGNSSAKWVGLSIGGSLLVSAMEFSIASIIQGFLYILEVSNTPPKIPIIPTESLSVALILSLLIGFGSIRALGQYFMGLGASHSLEVVNVSLRRILARSLFLNGRQQVLTSSQVHTMVGENFPKTAQFIYTACLTLSSSIISGLLFFAMLLTSPKEAALSVVFIAAIGYSSMFFSKKVKKKATTLPGYVLRLNESLERGIRNWLLLILLHTSEDEFAKVENGLNEYTKQSHRVHSLSNASASAVPLLGIIALSAIVWVSLKVFHSSGIAVVTFLFLFARLTQYLGAVAHTFGIAMSTYPYFAKTFEFLKLHTDLSSDRLLMEDKVHSEHTKDRFKSFTGGPCIEGKNLTFRYPGTEKFLIQNLNFKAEGGSQIAILGPSGTGKSTLLGLIIGTLQPNEGQILLDSVASSDQLKNMVLRIGYVGPEPFLLAGTIAENIVYGSNISTFDTKVWDALSKAQLIDTVQKLPGQLNYEINERGEGLSAGQKQRLCLARALLNNPNILILDEFSANLDLKTEAEIVNNLRTLKHKTTVVLVSHRTETIKYADYVLQFNPSTNREASDNIEFCQIKDSRQQT